MVLNPTIKLTDRFLFREGDTPVITFTVPFDLTGASPLELLVDRPGTTGLVVAGVLGTADANHSTVTFTIAGVSDLAPGKDQAIQIFWTIAGVSASASGAKMDVEARIKTT